MTCLHFTDDDLEEQDDPSTEELSDESSDEDTIDIDAIAKWAQEQLCAQCYRQMLLLLNSNLASSQPLKPSQT